MKIAVLADIHGNVEALVRTLADARRQGVERLVVLGDLIGYYYGAREVIEHLRDWPFDAIGGNHERLFEEALASDEAAKRYRQKYGSALEVACATLEPQDVKWLRALPDRAKASWNGFSFELCHGSPRDPNEYVYPDADAVTLEACRESDCDAVLMGHTHYAMLVAGPGPLLINPGSVGQAREQGGFASWVRIDTSTRAIVFQRTPYDMRPLVAEVRRRDPHLPYLADVLERGYPLPSGDGKTR
jgi:putative phosphoesterase